MTPVEPTVFVIWSGALDSRGWWGAGSYFAEPFVDPISALMRADYLRRLGNAVRVFRVEDSLFPGELVTMERIR